MRVALIISVLFLISGCYRSPTTYRLGSDIDVNEQNIATICSGDTYNFAVLCDQKTTANAIAVDEIISPAYENGWINCCGEKIPPVLYTFCNEVSQGEHKITLLAKRSDSSGYWLHDFRRTSYHYGECMVTTEAGHTYLTIPEPSDRSCYSYEHSDNVVVNITDKHSREVVGVCNMYGHISPTDSAYEVLNNLLKGGVKDVK